MSPLAADVSGAGPAVVLLHGQPGQRGDWARIAHLLGGDFTVIVPDRPGYGDTGGQAVGFRDNAAAVIDLLDALKVEKATVVGLSWAGAVALAMAEAVPDRVTGLVLVSSISPAEPIAWLDRVLGFPSVGAAVVSAGFFLASRALTLTPVRRTVLRRHQEMGVTGTTLDALAAYWRGHRVWQSFLAEQRCLVDELPQLADVPATVAVPTIVLVGDVDRLVPPAIGRRLAAAIPGATVIELHAGHLLAQQRPDAVVRAVRAVAAA